MKMADSWLGCDQVWDMQSGQCVQTLEKGHSSVVTDMIFWQVIHHCQLMPATGHCQGAGKARVVLACMLLMTHALGGCVFFQARPLAWSHACMWCRII